RVDEVLGLLQAQAGDRADDLDDLDLLAAGLGEDDVERGLLLLRRSGGTAGGARRGDCDRSGGGDAPLVLDLLLQLDELEHGHLSEALENAVYTSHGLALLLDCFSGSALAAQLFDPGLDEAIEVLHRRGDEPEEAGQ